MKDSVPRISSASTCLLCLAWLFTAVGLATLPRPAVSDSVDGETLADPLTHVFLKDLEQATEIQLTEWQHRSWSQRFLEGLAYRFRKGL